MIRRLIVMALACALPAVRCSDLSVAGKGGSSETVNAKVIIADTTVSVKADDPAIQGLTLRVYSPDYQPFEHYGYADSAISTTDSLAWSAPGQGTYCLFVTVEPLGSACFLRDIAVSQGSDTIECVLGASRDLSGYVAPVDSAALGDLYALSIYGSPFFAVTDSSLRFVIRNVPSGTYDLSVRSMAKRLFIGTASYVVVTDSIGNTTSLRVVLP